MRPTRPTGVTVMGILGIIYSSLFMLTCPLCCGVGIATAYPQLEEKFEEEAKKVEKADPQKAEQIRVMNEFMKAFVDNDTLKLPTIGIYVSYVFLGVILLAGSIGLFGLHGWARTLCVMFSVLSIIWMLATIGILVLVVTPEMETVVKDIARQKGVNVADVEQSNPISQAISLFCFMIPLLIMAISMLAVLLSRSASAAFNPMPVDDDDYPPKDGDDWGQPPENDPWKKDDDGIQKF